MATPAKEGTRTEDGDGDPDTAAIRGFLRRVLADDALADEVDELLFDLVVGRRFHPSLVATELPRILRYFLDFARPEDWRVVADELIAEARELEAGAESGRGPAESDSHNPFRRFARRLPAMMGVAGASKPSADEVAR